MDELGKRFIGWKLSLDRQAEEYYRDRAGVPRMDPERKFALSNDDYAYIAAIDGAFREGGRSHFGGFSQ